MRPLRAILTPLKDAEECRRLHEQDERTKWFGVVRDLTGLPILEDYGRYATLMSEMASMGASGSQFPQLVSFIGVTNAGKSSLVKMLIQHHGAAATSFPSPVVGGTVHDNVPTSGDVHLYADPSTYHDQLPTLYADCEGFEGGERVPLGSLTRKRGRPPFDGGDWEEPVFRRRPIHWASTKDSCRREFAVTVLYPRLLYTFSDCVTFVLRNPKTFQSAVLTKLLDWGATAMEMSLNQPALPHCIVVLNSVDPGIDERQWDVNYATQSLLATVDSALDHIVGVPRFRELASHWRRLGRHISTMEDLILCYYRSFTVVRIPAHPHYMVMNEQIGKLHTVIRLNCVQSKQSKQRARMLIGADEIGTYLQSGFDHFTTHLDVPFNFMQTSLQRNPIPSDFGGHILQLCITLNSRFMPYEVKTVRWMFEEMSVMLASCVLLDCVRFRKGHLDELFASYERFFRHAATEYLELHSPCSYRSPDGARSCALVKARHLAKGHQDEHGIIATGEHVAAFDWRFVERWMEQLKEAVEELHQTFVYELEQATCAEEGLALPDERVALDIHLKNIRHFFHRVGPATLLLSHSTCFCCVMDVPQHPLACKHVLCDKCVRGCGRVRERTVLLASCPLHPEDSRWEIPAVLRYKPDGAGIRILSLDNGGIRGIAQLEVLRAIEDALGGHMVVQTFFDLIVGAGTGGLIAAALQKEGQTVGRCLDMFVAICEHAYTPRLLLAPKSSLTPTAKRLTLVRQIERVFHLGPRYRSIPLYEALKTTFTDHVNFFGAPGQSTSKPRVIVTSANAARGDVTLLANYRRPNHLHTHYNFERVHDPTVELKTWECVAATMANPIYFKPLAAHNRLHRDGGTRCTNPAYLAAKEARETWPDVQEPDIFLSLGTGQNQATIAEKLRTASRGSLQSEADSLSQGSSRELWNMVRKWPFGRDGDIFEAEQEWQAFKAAARLHGKGLIRLNPDIGKEPPAQDRKDQLKMLQADVRKQLQEPDRRKAIDHVARRMVASAFYLDVRSRSMDEKGATVVVGSIACRFEDGTAELMEFGRVLNQRAQDGFEPYFSIRPWPGSTHVESRATITKCKIVRMLDDAVFERPNILLRLEDTGQAFSINLFLSNHDGLEPEGLPISGFPRGIVRHSSSDAHTPSAAPRTEDWTGPDSPTISESVFSRHPATLRRSDSSGSSRTTWSSVMISAGSSVPASDTREDLRVGVKQHPRDEIMTSDGDAPVEEQRMARCSYRRASRIGLEPNQLAYHVAPPRNGDDPIVPRPLQPRHKRGKGGGQGSGQESRPLGLTLGGFVKKTPVEEDPFYLELVGENTQMAPGKAHSGNASFDDTDTLNSFLGLYS